MRCRPLRDPVTDAQVVSVLTITLSKAPLDTANIGYQPPLPESEVEELTAEEVRPRETVGRTSTIVDASKHRRQEDRVRAHVHHFFFLSSADA